MQLPAKLMVGGGVALVGNIALFFFGIPQVVKMEVANQKHLKPGTLSRTMWEKPPFAFTFNVYLFNVTNPLEVTAGERPIVEEIGPFVYDEYKWKADCRDRESDDTISYRQENWWYFNKEKSGKLTGEEMVTLPNAIMLGILTQIERDSPGILSVANQAVKELFRKPKSVYMTFKVREVLFEGALINCTVREISTRSVCAILELRNSQEIKKVAKGKFRFSFLGGRNGTLGELMRVKRGYEDVVDVGKLVAYKEKRRLQYWPGEESYCNTLYGTDGTTFPPYLTKTHDVVSFSPDICRSLALVYEDETAVEGIPTYKFTSTFGDVEGSPEQRCYCRSKSTCPKKGTFDLTKCLGTPVVVSMPHFYGGTTASQVAVLGLNPDKDKHEIIAEFEPLTGTPIRAMARIQFNIEIKKVPQVSLTKNLRTTLHPILWVEEGVQIPEEFINKIKNELLLSLWLVGIAKWTFIAGSIGLVVGGKVLQNKRRKGVAVTPLVPEDTPEKKPPISVISSRDGSSRDGSSRDGSTRNESSRRSYERRFDF